MGSRRSWVRPRVAAVLALQLGLLGLLAAGAFGNGQDAPQVAATPQLATLTAVAHDTSPPLDEAPPLENDPNRVIPELERQSPATVSPTTPDAAAQTSVAAGPSVGTPLRS